MPNRTGDSPEHDRFHRALPVSVPPEHQEQLQALLHLLSCAARRTPGSRSTYALVGPRGQCGAIPDSLLQILERVVEFLARGDAVSVIPVAQELTTQQAADLLSVSRQYLVRILEQGQIPYTKTGTHRRLHLEDVLAFKQTRDQKRQEQLDELTHLSEESGGYPELE